MAAATAATAARLLLLLVLLPLLPAQPLLSNLGGSAGTFSQGRGEHASRQAVRANVCAGRQEQAGGTARRRAGRRQAAAAATPGANAPSAQLQTAPHVARAVGHLLGDELERLRLEHRGALCSTHTARQRRAGVGGRRITGSAPAMQQQRAQLTTRQHAWCEPAGLSRPGQEYVWWAHDGQEGPHPAVRQ